MVEREISGKVYVDGTEVGTVSGTYTDEVGATGGVSPVDLTYIIQIVMQLLPLIMLIFLLCLIFQSIK